jgi:hypothetical protein
LRPSSLAAAHGTARGFAFSTTSWPGSRGGDGSIGRWNAAAAPALLSWTELALGASESSRERTRRMMPRTARCVRPPGTPAVRGLAVVLVFFFAGADLGLWVRGLGGVASAGGGGTGGAESRLWVEDPWSHGGGGGAFGDGEKRGSGGGAMAGSATARCSLCFTHPSLCFTHVDRVPSACGQDGWVAART